MVYLSHPKINSGLKLSSDNVKSQFVGSCQLRLTSVSYLELSQKLNLMPVKQLQTFDVIILY